MVNFTGFKQLAHRLLVVNELGGVESNAYRISHARIGKSGFSFGVMQWDYTAGRGVETITDIMTNAVDADGNKILSVLQRTQIIEILDNNTFREGKGYPVFPEGNETLEKALNDALSSTYGIKKIDTTYSKELDQAIVAIETKISKTFYQDTLNSNDFFKLYLLDYYNQYGWSDSSPLMKYMQGQSVFFSQPQASAKINGTFGIDDLLTYILNNKFGYLNPRDALRRFSTVLSIVPYTVNEVEAKGIVYLYHNRMQKASDFVSSGSYTSIRSLVNSSKKLLIDSYAQDVNIDGDVFVGLGLESNAYIEDSFNDQNLQGTSKNDLIFGERGNDIINGLGGSDVIYGGDDVDFIDGGTGNDIIDGGNGADALFGGEGGDTLIGGDNDDTLVSGSTSTLYDTDSDTLEGGEGDDNYFVSGKDIIYDSDGIGRVFFRVIGVR